MTGAEVAREVGPGLVVRGRMLAAPTPRLADFRLAAFDMDSTLISIECIDEIAAAAGRKAEVAAITEAAMRGELPDYAASLHARLALLQGVPVTALQQVLDTRLTLNPGVEAFVAACHAAGLATLLVSGGFTFFSAPVRQRLGIGFMRSHELEFDDGRLTGRLLPQAWGSVVDGAEKRRTLLELSSLMGVTPAQCIAVGDGANDLPMMAAAGLSIAFHAKPAVRERADIAVNQGGLDRALPLLGVAGPA
jgi:phosphoserine phosphatase